MQLQGEEHIALAPPQVWAALNDPATLQACIPGCESLEPSEDGFTIAMLAAIGPVRARFKGKMSLQDVVPPHSYTIVFEGSGGVAGFGKGRAEVALQAQEGGTRLSYRASAQVGGKIAQVGSRLVDGVAARMAADFFARFKQALTPQPVAAALGAGAPPAPDEGPAASPQGARAAQAGWWRRLLAWLRPANKPS